MLLSPVSRFLGCQELFEPVDQGDVANPESPSFSHVGWIGPGWKSEWVDLVHFFAPLIYQDVDQSAADFLTRFTYDGNWDGGDNWEHTFLYPLNAYVYVSVVEDVNRYFIFYGTFHPRDWCTGPFCGINGAEHENDLEGVLITVDKRFTTASWPYGQVLTAETIFHNDYRPYKNCNLEGGFPLYVKTSDFYSMAFASDFAGCIFWEVDNQHGTTSGSQTRMSVFAEARGHGVKMWDGTPFGNNDGIVYFPSTTVAAVPPSFMSSAFYKLQWVHQGELPTAPTVSMWRKRLSNNGLNTFEYTPGETVGPWLVEYGYLFRAENQPAKAKAPWGQKLDDQVFYVYRGDWHNHPAWTWSQHYEPDPSNSPYYDYCRAPSCRMNQSYVANMFWTDSAASGGGGGGGSGFPPMLSIVGNGTSATQARPIPPEVRWDFNTFDGVLVEGDGVARTLLVELDDTEWGYGDGKVRALRIMGRGTVTLRFAVSLEPIDFNVAAVRFKQLRRRGVTLGWTAANETVPPPSRQVDVAGRGHAGVEWVVLAAPLSASDWLDTEQIREITLTLELDPDLPDFIDLDFIIIGS